MKKITANKIQINENISLKPMHSIKNDNWNYDVDVKADFNIAYDDEHIYLTFLVEELNAKAVYTKIDEPVYEDSCVEFFISFDKEYYYNLEFNCIGNLLGGYGKDKHSRESLGDDLLTSIKTTPSLGVEPVDIKGDRTAWTLDVVIPKSVFKHTEIETFKNKQANCNFYKCGDKQLEAHFLSWAPIKTDSPNFHKPEFFGDLLFD